MPVRASTLADVTAIPSRPRSAPPLPPVVSARTGVTAASVRASGRMAPRSLVRVRIRALLPFDRADRGDDESRRKPLQRLAADAKRQSHGALADSSTSPGAGLRSRFVSRVRRRFALAADPARCDWTGHLAGYSCGRTGREARSLA